MGGLKVRLSYARTCVLLAPESVSVGTSAVLTFLNAPAGQSYQFAASLGQSPPINFVTCKVCLRFDSVLLASILVGPPVFNYYAGVVPATGTAVAKFFPPKIPALIGLCVYHAAIAYSPKVGVICCSNTTGTLLK